MIYISVVFSNVNVIIVYNRAKNLLLSWNKKYSISLWYALVYKIHENNRNRQLDMRHCEQYQNYISINLHCNEEFWSSMIPFGGDILIYYLHMLILPHVRHSFYKYYNTIYKYFDDRFLKWKTHRPCRKKMRLFVYIKCVFIVEVRFIDFVCGDKQHQMSSESCQHLPASYNIHYSNYIFPYSLHILPSFFPSSYTYLLFYFGRIVGFLQFVLFDKSQQIL